MPRQSRLDAPGALHHVIARGIERGTVFRDVADYEDFLRRMESVTAWGKWTVFAWALIPNHVHLVIRTGPTPLASIMRRLMTGYAVSYDRRHGRSGHLFQDRYKSIVCDEEEYLLERIRYVGLNPLRAGLASDMEALDRYPYGSRSVLVGKTHRTWQEVEDVLARFGAKVGPARKAYGEFVAAGMG